MDDIQKILEEIRDLSRENHKMTKKIKRFVTISEVMGIIKLALIITPIVLGFIYLPPILKDIANTYKNLLGIGQNGNGGGIIENLINQFPGFNRNMDFENIEMPPELMKLLNKEK